MHATWVKSIQSNFSLTLTNLSALSNSLLPFTLSLNTATFLNRSTEYTVKDYLDHETEADRNEQVANIFFSTDFMVSFSTRYTNHKNINVFLLNLIYRNTIDEYNLF